MFISFSRIGKLSTVCAALLLLSGCTEVLSFGVGFGAGFFTGQYYANAENKEKMAAQAQMSAAQAPVENQAYSQQQAAAAQQPAPIPMGGYGGGYGGGYYDPYAGQAPMPMAAPAYDPYAAQPPAYAAAPAAYPDPAYGAAPQGGYPPLPATNAPAYAAAPAAYPAPQGYGAYPPAAAPAYGYQ